MPPAPVGERRPIDAVIRPQYPAAPASTADLFTLATAAWQLRRSASAATAAAGAANSEVTARQGSTGALETVVGVTTAGGTANQAHQTDVVAATDASTQLGQVQGEAAQQTERGEAESMGLAVGLGMLRGVRGIAQILMLPILPARAHRAGQSIINKANELIGALTEARDGPAQRRQELARAQSANQQDQAHLQGVAAGATANAASWTSQQETAQGYVEGNQQRIQLAQEAAAAQTASAGKMRAKATQIDAQHAAMSAALAAWAVAHRQCREAAVQTATAQLATHRYAVTGAENL